MIRTAAVAGFILGAATVLGTHVGVRALRRHRTKRVRYVPHAALVARAGHEAKQPPPPPEPVPPVVSVAVVPPAVPPARNGDRRPPTPNLDKILAERLAAEQRDDPPTHRQQ